MAQQSLKYKFDLYNIIKPGIDWMKIQFTKKCEEELLGTWSTFWFILNGGVSLNLFSPISCMSLFEFAMTQLWQDYFKNIPLWVSNELWDSKECILECKHFDFLPISYRYEPYLISNRYRYLIYPLFQTNTNYITIFLIPIPVSISVFVSL